MKNKDLKRRIIELSYKYKLSHLGSVLTAVDIIDRIFTTKVPLERFVLSSGHAGLALYTVLEKYGGKNAEDIWNHHGVHPDRCGKCGLDCSSGSLGNGLSIALGMALSDRSKNCYCLISDGECAEGSIWEALTIRQKYAIGNLKIFVNYNGWGAYDKIDAYTLHNRLIQSGVPRANIIYTNFLEFPFLTKPTPQAAHYHTMTAEDYKEALEILK